MLLKEIISDYRKANRLSQRAFAAKCGVTNGYMSMIENGLNPSTGKAPVPSFSKLKQIANGMDMTVHQLIQIADDMEIDIGSNDMTGDDIDQLSPAALAVARAYDKMSGYGRSMIDKIVENEKKYKIVNRVPTIEEAYGINVAHDSDLYARYNAMREQKELDQEQESENKTE